MDFLAWGWEEVRMEEHGVMSPTQNDPDEGDVGDEPCETDEAVEPHQADLDIHMRLTSIAVW